MHCENEGQVEIVMSLLLIFKSLSKTLCVLLACFFISVFLVIYLQYSSRQLTRANLELDNKLNFARMRWEQLLVEKAILTSRDRLEVLAEKMDLVRPEPENIIIYDR